MNFDYDLFVIGAGPGGLAAAKQAADLGARVAIAERSAVGGACVNYGCIPEKLMTYAARFSTAYRDAEGYGWDIGAGAFPPIRFNWARFIAAKNQEVQHLNQVHLSKLQKAGVELIQAHAAFQNAHTLSVGDRQVTADKILIAVGAKPTRPAILGAEYVISWHELFSLKQQPARIAIIGDRYIAVKFAGILNHLGSQVTQVFLEDRILSAFDHDLSASIQAGMQQGGIRMLAHTKVEEVEPTDEGLRLKLWGDRPPLVVDAVLVDTGSAPALDSLNLEQAGIETSRIGAVCVDERSRTTQENIFAVGDCTNRKQLTPVAIAEAAAFVDSEFGNQPHTVDYNWVPTYISSLPEAATVGMSEAQAREALGDAVRCYRKQFKPLFYSLAPRAESTLMKLVIDSRSDRIMGIHMVGEPATEIVQSLAVALKLGATLEDFRTAIGIHPSIAEEFWSID